MTNGQKRYLGTAIKKLQEAVEIIEKVRDTQQEYYDDRSENWQDSDKGMECQDEIDTLDNLHIEISDCADTLSDMAEE